MNARTLGRIGMGAVALALVTATTVQAGPYPLDELFKMRAQAVEELLDRLEIELIEEGVDVGLLLFKKFVQHDQRIDLLGLEVSQKIG